MMFKCYKDALLGYDPHYKAADDEVFLVLGNYGKRGKHVEIVAVHKDYNEACKAAHLLYVMGVPDKQGRPIHGAYVQGMRVI